MPNEKDDKKNEKLADLANQVKNLSKVVNELQAEVDYFKSKGLNSLKKDSSIIEKSDKSDVNGSKSNSSKRLSFFRKDKKTKADDKINSKSESSEKKDKDKKNEKPKAKNKEKIDRVEFVPEQHSKNKSIIRQEQADKNNTEQLFEVKNHERHRSPQSLSFPKEVEFSCIVEECTSDIENDIKPLCPKCNKRKKLEIENSDERIRDRPDKVSIKLKSGKCDKKCPYLTKNDSMKSITSKASSKCSKDCPYLVKDDNSHKKKKKSSKSKQKEASGGNCCKDQSHSAKSKRCGSKKSIFSFMKSDKAKAREFINKNDDIMFNPKLFANNTSCCNEEEQPQTSKLRVLDHDGKNVKAKESFCNRCFKKCKTKNVLKIKKAILTREPPVIVMSSRKC